MDPKPPPASTTYTRTLQLAADTVGGAGGAQARADRIRRPRCCARR